MKDSGYEAIQFQSNSAIGKSLEKIFQEVIDYRDKLPKEQQVKEVITYVKKTMKPQMIKAIKDNLNLTVENIIFYSKEISGLFAVELGMGNNELIGSAIDSSYGYTKVSSADKELTDLMNLYNSVDENGVFSKTTYGDNKPIFIILHFDILSAFLSMYYVDPKYVEPFTAKEITAIYLHEIGHFTSMIQRFKYDCFVMMDMENRINSLSSKYSPQEVSKAIINNQNKLQSLIRSIKDTKYDLQSFYNRIIKGCNTILYFEQTMSESSKTITKLYLVFRLIFKCVMFLFKTFWRLYSLVTLPFFSFSNILKTNTIIKAINALLTITDEVAYNKTVKISNSKDTVKASYFMEKDADEYTVRSGYGQYQASVLSKLGKIFEVMYTPGMPDPKYISEFTDLVELNLIFDRNYSEKITYGYEGDLARLKRLAQMTIPILKNLPDESKYKYLNQYEGIIKEISSLEKAIDNPVEKINKFVDYVCDAPYKFVRNILVGSVSQDYWVLQDQIEELVNNKLYYYGLKLKEL